MVSVMMTYIFFLMPKQPWLRLNLFTLHKRLLQMLRPPICALKPLCLQEKTRTEILEKSLNCLVIESSIPLWNFGKRKGSWSLNNGSLEFKLLKKDVCRHHWRPICTWHDLLSWNNHYGSPLDKKNNATTKVHSTWKCIASSRSLQEMMPTEILEVFLKGLVSL